MGVPAFFRWLTRKYPSVIIECVEKKTVDEDGKNVYEDLTLPNPNGVEFDNLYLDMNGIIHPCTHPEDKPPPKNEDEMMIAIFECIDRLFGIVRPRKVLYMAIDGVAPRAKMNQQRSRRFRAAKEIVEKRLEIQRIRDELLVKGCILPPEKPKEEHFDSNCITPGTPFMDRLSQCLHYFIHDRMNNHPAWKGIKVILSDANVPGEGEHKIIEYIRKQRAQPDHDPNTQHVLCGADADLIMLGLVTHEPNFTIIREEFVQNKPRPCEICGQLDHEMDKCEGLNDSDVSSMKPDAPISNEVQFIFVRLSVLREYLKKTLAMPNLPFKYDFERALDDWVFMCFFVGNDFLPHLPSLEIREGAVDRLVQLYQNCVYKTGGYITDSGEVNLDRVQLIMNDLGMMEDQIFKERQRREDQFKQRAKRQRTEKNPDFRQIHNSQFAPTPLGKGLLPNVIENPRQEAARFRNPGQLVKNLDAKDALDAMITPVEADSGKRGVKRKAEDMIPDDEKEEDYQNNDEVRLWEFGFKDRYYESKFDVGAENEEFRYSVALQYVRGLCWVLKYYYQGCASWKWYFPYHYAPFASDFVNISGLSTCFEKATKPFNPFEQLMSVFPAASSTHVPQPWAELMSNPKSTIIDFYPEDFKIDLNGKKFAWQGVALLPFVDERRLFKALDGYYDKLTEEEKMRNKCGESHLYLSICNSGYSLVKAQYDNDISANVEVPISIEGMQGQILISKKNTPIDGTVSSPITGLHDITENQVLTVSYRPPEYPEDFIYKAERLPKAVDPPNVLAPDNRDNNYRPVIGFNRNFPQASLSPAGHRMINSHGGYQNSQGGNSNYNNNRYDNQGGGGYKNNNRGGGGYSNYNRGGGGGGNGGNGGHYNNYQRNNNFNRNGGSNNWVEAGGPSNSGHNYQQRRGGGNGGNAGNGGGVGGGGFNRGRGGQNNNQRFNNGPRGFGNGYRRQ